MKYDRSIISAPLFSFLGFLLTASACAEAPPPPLGQSLTRFPEEAFPIPLQNQATPARVELGTLLFFDPVLSANKRVACATCHQPARAMADGLLVGAALADPDPDRGELPRSSPTIYNVRFQHTQFWDGRADSLEALAVMPIENPREMGSSLPAALATLGAIPDYVARFKAAYGGLDETSLRRAIACFLRTVTANDAPVDRYLAGDEQALGAEAIAGFNLFFGKARCSRCHYLPLFAGTEGPAFITTEFRVTGVPERSGTRLTSDRGNGEFSGDPAMEHAFKAPTLKNIEHTAPYMHNGAFTTLEQVIDFYDRVGDPARRGYDVPGLDRVLAAGPLNLSEGEKRQLAVFLREGLNDLKSTPPPPASVPSGLFVGGFPRQP